MAENIGGSNVFSSGGHRWIWGERQTVEKIATAVGVAGGALAHLLDGPRPGRIAGILRATGASRAAADSALDTLEAAVETLVRATGASEWEDDQGHTGTHLKVTRYVRQGRREYPKEAATWHAWQRYVCEVIELDGAPWDT